MAKKIPDDINFTGKVTFKDNTTYSDDGMAWDDFRVAGNTTRRGAANKPAFIQVMNDGASSVGVYADKFDADQRQDFFFSMQMPHDYKLNSPVFPHLHWMPLDGGEGFVKFEFEYTYADIDGTFEDTATQEVTVSIDEDQYKHIMTEFPNSIDPNFTGVSGMFMCRLSRLADDAGDTFTGDIAIIEFDIHYQRDSMGSRTATTK